MHLEQKKINTSIGDLYLVASEKGLQGVYWSKQKLMTNSIQNDRCNRILSQAAQQIEEYFKGLRKHFDFPLDLVGTDFQKKVWAQLLKIPFGETRSYKQIAIALGDKNASRAVGKANGRNPLCIIVPCHRVISSDGSLGGYSGGIKIKVSLLALERTGGIN